MILDRQDHIDKVVPEGAAHEKREQRQELRHAAHQPGHPREPQEPQEPERPVGESSPPDIARGMSQASRIISKTRVASKTNQAWPPSAPSCPARASSEPGKKMRSLPHPAPAAEKRRHAS